MRRGQPGLSATDRCCTHCGNRPLLHAPSCCRIAFIPFLVAGDPNLDTTAAALQKLDEIGADVIELGVPYSVRGAAELAVLGNCGGAGAARRVLHTRASLH
jgi:hypothetical protein